MHLGKRPRARAGGHMRRTTSMALLGSDASLAENECQDEPAGSEHGRFAGVPVALAGFRPLTVTYLPRFLAPETEYFLQACSLCKQCLGPGRDIYMYRGDAAFCSAECRNEQILIDERKEKCAVVVRKKESAAANHRRQSAASTNQNTLAAA